MLIKYCYMNFQFFTLILSCKQIMIHWAPAEEVVIVFTRCVRPSFRTTKTLYRNRLGCNTTLNSPDLFIYFFAIQISFQTSNRANSQVSSTSTGKRTEVVVTTTITTEHQAQRLAATTRAATKMVIAFSFI